MIPILALWGWGLLGPQELPPPILDVPPQVHVGRLAPGARRTLAIPLTHRGSSPLDILEVLTDCGCTEVVLPTRRLAPQQTVPLNVTLEAGPHAGPLEKKITLKTNDPHHPEQVIRLRALVKPLVTFRESQVVFQGFSRSDGPQTLEIPWTSERPLRPELPLETFPEWLSGFVLQETPHQGTLCLDLQPSALPLDRTSGQDILTFRTGIPEQPELRLEVSWKVRDALVIRGEPLVLSPQEPVGALTVQATDQQPILLSVDSKPEGLAVLGGLDTPLPQATLRFQWQGPWPPTPETHSVLILTDRSDQPQIWVQILVKP